jgi:hypothetical protein
MIYSLPSGITHKLVKARELLACAEVSSVEVRGIVLAVEALSWRVC